MGKVNSIFPQFVFDYESKGFNRIESVKNLVFHHIPKTAGSTFRALLESYYERSEVCPAETPKELQDVYNKGLGRYRLFAGHFSYSAIDHYLQDSVKVTFLRNPIERVVSHYYNHSNLERIPDTWRKRVNETPEWKQYIQDVQGVSLTEWLTHQNHTVNSIACNRQTQAFLPDEIRVGVEDWGVFNEEYLEVAKNNLESNFPFIGIQEYFDLSIDLFCMTLGINPVDASAFTTNLNTKKKFGKKYELTGDEAALVDERNRMDLELYNFAKVLFFDRLHTISRPMISLNRRSIVESMAKTGVIRGLGHCMTTNIGIEEFYGVYGFYETEQSDNRKFRWTGYDVPAILEFICSLMQGKEYLIEIDVVASMGADVEESITIEFDSQEVAYALRKEQDNMVIEIRIEATLAMASSGFHQIKLSTLLIKEHERTGARRLGLAVSGIKIK